MWSLCTALVRLAYPLHAKQPDYLPHSPTPPPPPSLLFPCFLLSMRRTGDGFPLAAQDSPVRIEKPDIIDSEDPESLTLFSYMDPAKNMHHAFSGAVGPNTGFGRRTPGSVKTLLDVAWSCCLWKCSAMPLALFVPFI